MWPLMVRSLEAPARQAGPTDSDIQRNSSIPPGPRVQRIDPQSGGLPELLLPPGIPTRSARHLVAALPEVAAVPPEVAALSAAGRRQGHDSLSQWVARLILMGMVFNQAFYYAMKIIKAFSTGLFF